MLGLEGLVPGKRVATTTRRSKRNRVLAALIAAAVAAALLFSGIGWSLLTDDSTSSSDEETSADGDAPQTGGTSDPEGDTALTSCSEEIEAGEALVAAADTGVRHWKAHVQARTDMLKGRISEKTMDAVWKRTQDAGPADQERFSAAQREYGGQPSCDELQDAVGSQSPGVPDCLARSEVVLGAVSTAQEAMDDWASHLHHMSEYADGGMTAGRAQRLWVEAWRSAPDNIEAHEGAHAMVTEAPPCAAAAN